MCLRRRPPVVGGCPRRRPPVGAGDAGRPHGVPALVGARTGCGWWRASLHGRGWWWAPAWCPGVAGRPHGVVVLRREPPWPRWLIAGRAHARIGREPASLPLRPRVVRPGWVGRVSY